MTARLKGAGVVLLLAGLGAWYAGGSDASDRLLRVDLPLLASLAAAAAAAGAAFNAARGSLRCGASAAVLLGAGVMLATWCALALFNRGVDRSPTSAVPTQILGFRQPAKGPRRVGFTWGGRRVEVRAALASGCAERQLAMLHVRRGALRLPWIESIDCRVPPQ